MLNQHCLLSFCFKPKAWNSTLIEPDKSLSKEKQKGTESGLLFTINSEFLKQHFNKVKESKGPPAIAQALATYCHIHCHLVPNLIWQAK